MVSVDVKRRVYLRTKFSILGWLSSGGMCVCNRQRQVIVFSTSRRRQCRATWESGGVLVSPMVEIISLPVEPASPRVHGLTALTHPRGLSSVERGEILYLLPPPPLPSLPSRNTNGLL